jgi:biotin transport system substrate-specific component
MFGDLKRSRLIAYTAVFIGLIAAGSWMSFQVYLVPITLQTLFVLLAGIVMRRYAVIPVSLYVLLGTLGLPLFHSGASGPGVLLGPTGGYLIGFIAAAGIVGLAYERRSAMIRICGIGAATAIILISGVAWLIFSTATGVIPALTIGVLQFIPGDILKAVAAYYIGKRLP